MIVLKNLLFSVFIAISIYACQPAVMIGANLADRPLRDGTYTGRYRNGPNAALVKVTVLKNRIEHVEVVRHFSSWKGSKANIIIPQRIVTRQSTRVDAVTGATNSSIVIMNAAQTAIEKAYRINE